MKNRSLLSIVLACSGLALAGCGGDGGGAASTPTAAAAPAAGKAAPKPKKQTTQELTAPALTVPDGYRYDPRGRRDPFLNPIPKPVAPPPAVPTVRPEGMRGMMVAEVKITGIVASREPGMTKAILSAGKQTYFAVQGDALLDGVIKEIRPDGVVFTMISPATRQPINRETVVRTGNSGGTSTGEKK